MAQINCTVPDVGSRRHSRDSRDGKDGIYSNSGGNSKQRVKKERRRRCTSVTDKVASPCLTPVGRQRWAGCRMSGPRTLLAWHQVCLPTDVQWGDPATRFTAYITSLLPVLIFHTYVRVYWIIFTIV